MAAESRRKRARMRSAALALLIGAGLGLPGCGTELDTERITPTRGSIGAEIYKVVCERMASEALPSDVSGEQTRALCRGAADPSTAPSERLRVLAENRDRLVGALDQVFPEAMADDLDAFLLQMVPFYDGPEERLPQQTRAAADLLTRIMDDPEALDALARLGQRVGYRPLRLGLGIARPMMAYPRLTELTNQALATVAEGGVARSEWEALLEATALEMASAAEDPAPAAEPSTLALTRDLLMRQADVFGAGASRPMVLRDSRGMALPLSTGGALPAPFADVDGDGLADIDSLGRFVDASGAAIDAPSPFPRLDEPPTRRDPIGRALGADGAPLFAYHDVNTTLLAGVIREALPLLDPAAPALLDLGYGAPALLGPSAPALETFGAHALSYEGFEL
ncbi:MAG: hypothetical protein OEY14_05920, partial [Myxococcales bacterium]|nr:hypothetical protein [Myxococcales bacterium]